MSKLAQRAVPLIAAAAFGFAVAPGTVNAQEQQQEGQEKAQQTCTAQVAPEAVPSGQQAVAVNVRLSQDIGPVVDLKAASESGLALAAPDQIRQKTEMAREGESPQPIQMSSSGEVPLARVWLNTAEATEGTHEVALKNEEGKTCKAQVTVEAPEEG